MSSPGWMEAEELLLLKEVSYQCNNPVGPHFTISNTDRFLTLQQKRTQKASQLHQLVLAIR